MRRLGLATVDELILRGRNEERDRVKLQLLRAYARAVESGFTGSSRLLRQYCSRTNRIAKNSRIELFGEIWELPVTADLAAEGMQDIAYHLPLDGSQLEVVFAVCRDMFYPLKKVV